MRIRPDDTVDTALDVDYAALRARGTRALLFDLDRTLGPRKAKALPRSALGLLSELSEQGFAIGVLSNRRCPEGDPVMEMLAQRYELLHTAGKPRRRGYLALLGRLGVEPSQAAMVGDKWITDMVGAKRLGILAIRVRRPIHD